MSKEDNKMDVLVIDDDPVYRNFLRSLLKEKYNVYAIESPSIAFKILKNQSINIVICDFKLPEMNGIQVLERLKNEYPEIEVIMISSSTDLNTVIGALRQGAVDYFKKPFEASDIWMSIERTLKYAKLNKTLNNVKGANRRLKQELETNIGNTFIGESNVIKKIKDQIKLVAQTPDTSVLIIGESGTGKELVARDIHNQSSRHENFFGAVNMSAVPESLFESEFFGHKKGSFTGAIADKSGWFESANKGTLFFDEIGEMNITMQVKLLRVLEDRAYTKVGIQQSKKFDIRILSATNKSIDELSEGNNFRIDLYHRLSTFIIHIPPLRERKEDIPLLCAHFLSMLTKKIGKKIDSVNESVYNLFNEYHFPGNIRELKNLMERAIILCVGKQLKPEHFSSINLTKGTNPPARYEEVFDLKELERGAIIRALEKTNGNKSEAAKILNIEWNALYRRMQKYKID